MDRLSAVYIQEDGQEVTFRGRLFVPRVAITNEEQTDILLCCGSEKYFCFHFRIAQFR